MCHEPKGVATYVRAYNLAKAMALRGHHVTLICVSPNSAFRAHEEIHQNLRIILTPKLFHGNCVLSRLTSCQGWGILDILKRINEGKSSKYDIIHTFDHFPNIAIPLTYIRRASKAKIVSDWCDLHHLPGGFQDTFKYRFDILYRNLGFPFRHYLNRMELEVRRKAHAVTVISKKLKEVAISYRIDDKYLSIIEGGADTESIIPLPKIKSRERIGLPANSKIVGFLGRSQFDLDILIRSIERIKKGIPNLLLLVIGQNLYPWTKQLAAELGIQENYREVGYTPDEVLPYYLSSADVFALPMKRSLLNEVRWPNKIGEYMASGRPTVVTNVGEVASVVNEHRIGLVAEPAVEHFAEKLELLLTNDTLAERLGRRARNLACKKYSWRLLAVRLEQIYYGLLSTDKFSLKEANIDLL